MRSLIYPSESGGGLVVIGLAYHPAMWEAVSTRNAAVPGAPVIAGPQNRLGRVANHDDHDFADLRLVESLMSANRERDCERRDGSTTHRQRPLESVAGPVVVHAMLNAALPACGHIADAVESRPVACRSDLGPGAAEGAPKPHGRVRPLVDHRATGGRVPLAASIHSSKVGSGTRGWSLAHPALGATVCHPGVAQVVEHRLPVEIQPFV